MSSQISGMSSRKPTLFGLKLTSNFERTNAGKRHRESKRMGMLNYDIDHMEA